MKSGKTNGKGMDRQEAPLAPAPAPDRPLTLSVDWEAYAPYLDDPTLSDDQKRELIETLWTIIVGFVDLGFAVHSADRACGQNGKSRDLCTAGPGDVVGFEPSLLTTDFAEAADRPDDGRGRETDS